MTADDLKLAALHWLRARYPTAHLLREFSVSEYGGAIVDVAAICEDQIVGVEVKGDGDTGTRLGLQAQMYPRVCRKVHLLPAPSLVEKLRLQKPDEWGLLRPPGSEPRRYSLEKRCAVSGLVYTNARHEPRAFGYGLSPMALSLLPWSTEGKLFRELLGVPAKGWPTRRLERAMLVSDGFPLTVIERAVCMVLRQRQWLGGKVVLKPEQEIV